MTDQKKIVLTESEVRDITEQAAEKAVETVLMRLGLDVGDPSSCAKLRDDLGFLARMNSGAREIKVAAIKTCIGAVIMGAFAIFLIGFKDWLIK